MKFTYIAFILIAHYALFGQKQFSINHKVLPYFYKEKNICQINLCSEIKNNDKIPYTIILGDTCRENDIICIKTDFTISPISNKSRKKKRLYPYYQLHVSCPGYDLSNKYTCFVLYPDSTLTFKYQEEVLLKSSFWHKKVTIDFFIWFYPQIEKLSLYQMRACMTTEKDETIQLRYILPLQMFKSIMSPARAKTLRMVKDLRNN